MKPIVDLKPPEQQIANIQYRKAIRKWALRSPQNRDWLMKKSRDDFFFWIKTFCWLMEPRPEEGRKPVFAFIPWSMQYPFFQCLLDNYGKNDVGVEKARGLGASWCSLYVFIHRWLFFPNQILGVVSRSEEMADDPGDISSLGAKIDWALNRLPQWMAGVPGKDFIRNLSKHTWKRPGNESLISCYATTKNLAAGGRTTCFLLDEYGRFPRGDDEDVLAATEPVTNSRFFVSTYEGCDGAFYRIMHEPSNMVRYVLRWEDCSDRNQPLFRINKAESQLLLPDKDEPLGDPALEKDLFEDKAPMLLRRGFDLDDKSTLWSPWFIERCLRPGMNPRFISQEYQRNPAGSAASFFPSSLILPLIEKTRPPVLTGDVTISAEKLRVKGFLKSVTGALRLWVPLSSERRGPPPGNYVIGADVATGVGGAFSSNSSLSIVNRGTGEKVGEYASPLISPEKFAELTIALCRWFSSLNGHPAYLIWESSGPGGAFGQRIMASDFGNFYWRTPWDSSVKKPTKVPGFATTRNSKADLLSKYRYSLQEGYFYNPSELALRECQMYAHLANNAVAFKGGSSMADDPSNAGMNHGDRVIADALASYAVEDLGGGAATAQRGQHLLQNTGPPPPYSFAARQAERRAADKRCKEGDW